MREPKPTITVEQAADELEEILALDSVDDVAFARGNFCMRMLGVPISDSGKFKVVEDQTGDNARYMWDQYAEEREWLRNEYSAWREIYEP